MAAVIAFLLVAGKWLIGVLGNRWKEALGVIAFIAVLCIAFCRPAHSAEVDLRAGSSFGPGGYGPVLGLNLYFPIGNTVDLFASTTLWGATSVVPSNWDWTAGVRTCRWRICASLGASYLQRVDSVIGSHTDYALELSYLIGWKRVSSIDVAHRSDAGTTPVNRGLNAALVSFRLQ